MEAQGEKTGSRPWLRLLTAVYVVVLIGIVAMADKKGTRRMLAFIHNVPFGDKLGHFFLMGLLSLLANLSLSNRTVTLGGRRLLFGSTAVFVVVFLEELSQIFIPGRTFDLIDLTCDLLGIWAFGRLSIYLLSRQSTGSATR